jgi:hypothetical protein
MERTMSGNIPEDVRYIDLTAAQVAFLQQTVPVDAKRNGLSATIETTQQSNGLMTATIHFAVLDHPDNSPAASGIGHALLAHVGIGSDENIASLSAVLMSEASVGNDAERTSVGFTVLNRLKNAGQTSVHQVWNAYAHNQSPTEEMMELARQLLAGQRADITDGSTHFYSPQSMPKEGQVTAGFDVGGGLELVPPLRARTFAPSWTKTMKFVDIPGVRPSFFKFYKPV